MKIKTRRAALGARISLTAILAIGATGSARAAGEVYWFSLLTENPTEAMDFYTGLFGWTVEPSPTGASLLARDGMPFAGVNRIESRMPDASESLWLASIQVDNVEVAERKALELGGTVLQSGTRLEGWGTFAIIQDPQGAPAILVNPERPLGGTEGYTGWAWAELWTHDTAAAADFYSQVVGYQIETVDVGGQPYQVFGQGEAGYAGLVQLRNPDVAPRWAPYVGVNDLRSTLVRVWQQGGEVLLEPSEVESEVGGAGRKALIADPTGAALFLYQLNEQATSDPIVRSQQIQSRSAVRRPDNSSAAKVSVYVNYSFGPGWSALRPGYPYSAFGPPYPFR